MTQTAGPAGVSRRALVGAAGSASLAGWGPALAGMLGGSTGGAQAGDEPAWTALQQPGAIFLMRHAHAPGVGDPPEFRLGACGTQRNLDEQGRQEARRLGEMFRERGIRLGAVLTSQWCRARDTARLAFGPLAPGGVRDEPVFNSFFAGHGHPQRQTAAARALLRRWQGSGVLVVVTHQVNVHALTDAFLAPAEGLVVRPSDGDAPLPVLARLRP